MLGAGEAFLMALLVIAAVYGLVIWFTRHSDRIEKKESNIECRLLLLEHTLIDKFAKKKGIDLVKEELKEEMTPRGKLREKLYKEILEDTFGKEEKKKKA